MMRGNLASKATPSTRAPPPIQSTTDAEPLSTVLRVLSCGYEWGDAECGHDTLQPPRRSIALSASSAVRGCPATTPEFWLEVILVGVMQVYGALLQIPGVDVVELTLSEQISTWWDGMGFMRWPVALCLFVGIITIIRSLMSHIVK